MFIATIGLVAVSLFGVAVSYFFLRSHVDPEVVVYTAHDDRRPSVLILVIENIGPSPAYDVRFKLSRPIPKNAWGIKGLRDDRPAETMREGPLIDGIPILGPNGRRVLTWGQFGALREALGEAPVRVSATYESRRRFPWDPTEHTSNSILEIRSFLATDVSESPELRGVKALEQLSKDLSVIRAGVQTVAAAAQRSEIDTQS
ncbi:hypothetical protein [Candidatus Palauibacter sp.]|uniref:hypothetical protein n=1 Tax=Candidatus Palauibacter sp. TaxID=3101350 RepID=UPI003B59598C